ncbi:MAG TPA: hypothetical protein VKF38_09430 [Anaerolineaceae bacterium]|nr:hypothetical protein [Anaerolineaceae bacterium]
MRLSNPFSHLFNRPKPESSSKLRIDKEKFQQMLKVIEQTRPDELSCDEIENLLCQFSEVVQEGGEAAGLMPLIEHHLQICPDCREEFEALLRVLGQSNA